MRPNTAHMFPLLLVSSGLAIGLAAGTARGAHAETWDDSQPENESENQMTKMTGVTSDDHAISFSAYARGTVVDEADFDSDIGTFKYTAFNLGLNASRHIGDSGQISVAFDAGLINYDIDASPLSVAGDAASIGAEFDDVTTLSLVGIYADQFNETSTWYIGGGVLSGSEDDADFGDSIDGLIFGGYRYKFNDQLELGIGVAVRSRLDDDVLIVPVPEIIYTVNEFWSIETEGIGLKINYKASDSLDYGVTGEFASTTFRLNDSHSFAVDGVATHRRFPLAFYAQLAPNETVEIIGTIGAELGGELEVINTSGNEVASQDLDTGVFGSLSVRFKF